MFFVKLLEEPMEQAGGSCGMTDSIQVLRRTSER